jgi:site-specific DNA-adenine methylase
MDKLKHPEYRAHLDKLTFVENMDFQQVVEKYDSPTTYFYMDPPYWKTENYYSNHDFDADDHKRLADTLKAAQGKFSLSYYEFPQLNEWFPRYGNGVDENGQLSLFAKGFRWESQTFKKAAGSKKDGTQNEGIELLIMNY